MANFTTKFIIILGIILTLIGLSGCVEDTGIKRFIGTWELIDADEITMILKEDGTTNVWNDPQLAEQVGDNFSSNWSLQDRDGEDWIFFNYNFTTYEKNFRFKYRFEGNGNLIFIDTTYNIEFEFRRI